jgi:hypothetical protein
MTADLGIMCIKLENNLTSNTILKTARSLIDNNPYNHICIYNSYSEIVDNNFVPILHISQAKFLNGNLILFDIPSLILSNNFIGKLKRFYYAYETPWTQHSMPFKYWSQLFDSDNLNIIAKNQYLYDIYDICWKKPIGISEDFSYETIKDLL